MKIWARVLSVVTAFCLLTSFIAVGHGVAPFGLLIGWDIAARMSGDGGAVREFAVVLTLIMLGAFFLLVGSILPRRVAFVVMHIGIFASIAGFAIAIWVSDPAITTIIFSSHFIGSVFGLILLLHHRRLLPLFGFK